MTEKLQGDNESARKRAAALLTKRGAAKSEFDATVQARESYLLTGNINEPSSAV
jgi:hypothetical protein